MSEYRRWRTAGGTYFFTIVTFRRRPILADPSAVAIRGRWRQALVDGRFAMSCSGRTAQ